MNAVNVTPVETPSLGGVATTVETPSLGGVVVTT